MGGTKPAAFMSYVRSDDAHDDGQLTQFRERLEAEVRAQTGKEFAIFQDRNDIGWGQNWQRRIDQALDAVTLLVGGHHSEPIPQPRRAGPSSSGSGTGRMRWAGRT